MCVILYRHCPGCYGMKNNRRRVEFCPKMFMAKNGWIPGIRPRKSEGKSCKKALHYQEEHWRLQTYKSHKHIPGLKGKLPPEKSAMPFSGKMADLEIEPTRPWDSNEQNQDKKPSKEEWTQCLTKLAFPSEFVSSQPERPSDKLRLYQEVSEQELKKTICRPSPMFLIDGLITPPSDSDGFNPVIPSDLEPWSQFPVPAEGVHKRGDVIFQESCDNETESELSEPPSTPSSRPMSPPPSPPRSITVLPLTKKRTRHHAETLCLGKKMLKRPFQNAKKTYETGSKRMIKGKVKK